MAPSRPSLCQEYLGIRGLCCSFKVVAHSRLRVLIRESESKTPFLGFVRENVEGNEGMLPQWLQALRDKDRKQRKMVFTHEL